MPLEQASDRRNRCSSRFDLEIVQAIRRGVVATVYTQLADVEDEVNGLITYDRRVVKVDATAIRSMTDRPRAAAADDGGENRS